MAVLTAHAQQSLDSTFRTTGPEVVSAFEPQRTVLQTSSAVIEIGRKQLSYGVVITAHGHILTKASEIENHEKLAVRVDRQMFDEVEILGVDPVWDVALLKVDAQSLTPVTLTANDAADIPHGTWVVANGASSRFARRAMAGVISAKPRSIPAAGGAMLGVVFKAEAGGLKIQSIVEGSGAEQVGLAEGDLIISVNGHNVENVEQIVEAIGEKSSGETVEVIYLRDGNEFKNDVPLISRNELLAEQMIDRNDMMSGDYSKRRSGFPRVIQHDILGNSNSMGGPVLDLDGHCIGMNIARANRAETFAIPAKELREIAERLIGDP